MILYGGGMGNGNLHEHSNLPTLVAGRLSGQIRTGRHLAYPADTPMSNLFMALVDKTGIEIEKFGDSTGRLPLETLSGV